MERIKELVTNAGFVRVFWDELKAHPEKTHRQIFNELNEAYEREYGCAKWTFDAFRKYRDRH